MSCRDCLGADELSPPAPWPPLAEAALRCGSGENGADSGLRSVTLMYRNARAPMLTVVL